VLAVITLFTVLIYRALVIGRAAENRERPFAGYVAYGLGVWIGLQAFINIGVNMGVLPTKGLTLPFMSYGGSSILVMCIVIALLVRIDFETRRDDRNVQRRSTVQW
jgi:cell division protein FtsW